MFGIDTALRLAVTLDIALLGATDTLDINHA